MTNSAKLLLPVLAACLAVSLSSQAAAQDVPFKTLIRGRTPSSSRVGAFVIQKSEDFARARVTPPTSVSLDFTRDTLLFVSHRKGGVPVCKSIRREGDTLRVLVAMDLQASGAQGRPLLLLRIPKTSLTIDFVYELEFKPVDVHHAGFHITGIDTLGTARYMTPVQAAADLRPLLGRRVVVRGRTTGGFFRIEKILSPQRFDEQVRVIGSPGALQGWRGMRSLRLEGGPQNFLAGARGRLARVRGFLYPRDASGPARVVVSHVQAFARVQARRSLAGAPDLLLPRGAELEVHGEAPGRLLTRTPGQASFSQTPRDARLGSPFFFLPLEGQVSPSQFSVTRPPATGLIGAIPSGQ